MPVVIPYAPTQIYQPNGRLADLIRQSGQDAAAAAERRGQISAQLWGNIGNTIQNTVGNVLQQQAPQRQLEQLKLEDAQRTAVGNKLVAGAMQPSVPNGDTGPSQPSDYLTKEGDVALWDIPKLTSFLSRSGFGDKADTLLSGAQQMNDAHRKEASARATFQQAQQNTTAKAAGTLYGMLKDMSPDQIASAGPQLYDLVASQHVANGAPPSQAASIRAQLFVDPSKTLSILNALSQSTSEKATPLAEGAILPNPANPSGPPLAINPKVKDLTSEQAKIDSYIASLGLPNGTKWEALTPDQRMGFKAYSEPEKPPRPLDQQLLEAIAKGDDTAKSNILTTIAADASAKRDPVAMAQLESIRNLTQAAAQERLDNDNPASGKNQQRFEQEYRTVLQRGLSSRSGGLGLEDAKVQQANHLMSIFEQNFDPKTGEWNIPRVQLNELALGLARLTAPGGQAGEGMLKEFQQRTAKGDLAGALTYLTGQPIPANTQAITQMLKDSIERQGRTAMTNREGEMAYLRGLAPTDLNEDRRKKLETTTLNPLRQSRVIQNTKTGERKLQVSTDGGATWQ